MSALFMRMPTAMLGALLVSTPVLAQDHAPTAPTPYVSVSGERGGVARVQAWAHIPETRAEVWAAMLDCAAAPAFVPGLLRCRVLEAEPDGRSDTREHTVAWARLLPPSRNVFRSEYSQAGEPWSIRFERVEGAFDVMEGEWTLSSVEEGRATRLAYRARLSVPMPGSGPLVRRAARRNTPKIFLALQTYLAASAQNDASPKAAP